jgi:hypothetical protein
VDTFLERLKAHERAGAFHPSDRGIHLSALFDLAITGIYTNNLFENAERFARDALLSGPTEAFFPYTWMDPRSLAAGLPLTECYLPEARRDGDRDFPDSQRLAKPGGRFIGDAGIKVLRAILRRILRSSVPGARLRDGGGLRGEFDLTITSQASNRLSIAP